MQGFKKEERKTENLSVPLTRLRLLAIFTGRASWRNKALYSGGTVSRVLSRKKKKLSATEAQRGNCAFS